MKTLHCIAGPLLGLSALLALPGCFTFSVWHAPPETLEVPATVVSISRSTAPAPVIHQSILFIEYTIDAPRGSPSAIPVTIPAKGVVEILADSHAMERFLLTVRNPTLRDGSRPPSITVHLRYSRAPSRDGFQAWLERMSCGPGAVTDSAMIIDLTGDACRIRDPMPDRRDATRIDWPADVPPRMTFRETRPSETPRLAGRIFASPAAAALDAATIPLQTLLFLVAYVQTIARRERASGFMRL
jgi:hypothetical protein